MKVLSPGVRKVLNVLEGGDPLTSRQIAGTAGLSYRRTIEILSRLRKLGIISKVGKEYLSSGDITPELLVKNPHLLRSRHIALALRALNMRPLTRAELARVLGVSRAQAGYIATWLLEDGFCTEDSSRKLWLTRHFGSVDMIEDNYYIAATEVLIDSCGSMVRGIVYSEGEVLVIANLGRGWKREMITRIASASAGLERVFITGPTLWSAYLACGYRENPFLMSFVYGMPVHGNPRYDPWAAFEEVASLLSEGQMKAAKMKGLIERDARGWKVTERYLRRYWERNTLLLQEVSPKVIMVTTSAQ